MTAFRTGVMMSEAIIVGAVESSAGAHAIAWAAQRAADREQRIVLYGIVGGAAGAVGASSMISDALQATEEFLQGQAETLRARGLSVETRTDAGDPVALLIEASRSSALLVIGSDYRGPGTGPARGVHGIRIAAGAHCPVVVVPDHDLDATGRTGVVVGVDGSPVSEAAVRFAASEADRLGEPLIAVTTWTPLPAPRHSGAYPHGYLESMSAMAEETLALALAGLRQDYPDLRIDARTQRGYPSEVINGIAATSRLAVIGSHGRGPIARFLLGSISHEVLARLATATAIVR